MSFQSKYIIQPRKHLKSATCAKELNKLVADKFSIVKSAQIADKPVLPVAKAVAEKAVRIEEVAAGVFDKSSPRADADVIPLAEYDRLNIRLLLCIVVALHVGAAVQHCNGVSRDRLHHAERPFRSRPRRFQLCVNVRGGVVCVA